jgi:hypothetical protein
LQLSLFDAPPNKDGAANLLEPENREEGRTLRDRSQPPTIVDDRAARRLPHPSVRHEQPSYTRSEGGDREHKHGQERGVHGTNIRILELCRRRQRIASVRRWLWSIPYSIHMPHIRPRRGRRHGEHRGGGGRWQGMQEEPEAKKRNACQEEENSPSHPWPLSRAQSPFPFSDYPAHSARFHFLT